MPGPLKQRRGNLSILPLFVVLALLPGCPQSSPTAKPDSHIAADIALRTDDGRTQVDALVDAQSHCWPYTCDESEHSEWPGLWWPTDFASDLMFDDGLLYVAMGAAGLGIFRVLEDGSYSLFSMLRTVGFAERVRVEDDIAVILDLDSSLEIIDVTAPDQPQMRSRLDCLPNQSSSFHAIEVRDGIAYVCRSPGLAVVDLRNPDEPVIMTTLELPGGCSTLAFAGEVLVMGTYGNGLLTFDVSEPCEPTLVGSTEAFWPAKQQDAHIFRLGGGDGVAVINLDWSFGLGVVDLSNPLGPFDMAIVEDSDGPLFTLVSDIAVEGDQALVALHNPQQERVCAIDLKVPMSPMLLSCQQLHDQKSLELVSGAPGRVHVATAEGLVHVDLEAQPEEAVLAEHPVFGSIEAISRGPQKLYAVTGNRYLLTFDDPAGNLSAPTSSSKLPEKCSPWDVRHTNNRVLVACGGAGVVAYDDDSGGEPTILYTPSYGSEARFIRPTDDLLIAGLAKRLVFLDPNGGEDSAVLGEYTFESSHIAKDLVVSENLIGVQLKFVSFSSPTTKWIILDATDPSLPILLTENPLPGEGPMILSPPTLVTSTSNSTNATLSVFEIKSPFALAPVGEVKLTTAIRKLALTDGVLAGLSSNFYSPPEKAWVFVADLSSLLDENYGGKKVLLPVHAQQGYAGNLSVFAEGTVVIATEAGLGLLKLNP